MASWDVSRETCAACNALKIEPSSILMAREQQLSSGLGGASVSSFPGVTSRAHQYRQQRRAGSRGQVVDRMLRTWEAF